MPTLYIETTTATGAWEWKLSDNDPKQPHLIRVAALLCRGEKTLDSVCRLVAPQPSWPMITPQGTRQHGMDQNDLATSGVLLDVALTRIRALIAKAGEVVAFNAAYHERVLRRAYRDGNMDTGNLRTFVCVMRLASVVSRAGGGSGRFLKLSEIYSRVAHEALVMPADPTERGMRTVEAVRLVHRHLIGVPEPEAA